MLDLIGVIEYLELTQSFNLFLSRLIRESCADECLLQVINVGMSLLLYLINSSFEMALLLEGTLQSGHFG